MFGRIFKPSRPAHFRKFDQNKNKVNILIKINFYFILLRSASKGF